ncbi:MAG TPA: peptide ABC transporter substrate-binding protein [Gemmatimonadaceae bacterium]|nr:peptide ABC transporter substrate-binding protein [Gemmatimonadaceae bacterium]
MDPPALEPAHRRATIPPNMISTRRFAAAAVLVLATACSGPDDRDLSKDVGGTVVITVPLEPDFLLPQVVSSIVGKVLSDQLFEPLAALTPEMNPFGDKGFEPRLAKSWTWAPDSMSIAFSINPRARWHDGRPVRAEDVRLGFDLLRDTLVAAGQGANVADIDSVQVRDSLTAVIWFKRRALDQFFAAVVNIIPVPAHILGGADRASIRNNAFVRAPVGSGRFRFVRWVPGQLVELIADTANFLGRAKLDRVVLSVAPDANTAAQRLLSGEADFYEILRGDQLASAQKSPNIQVKPYGGVDIASLQLNLRDPRNRSRPHPVFGNREIRRALTHAIDRVSIARNIYDTLASVPFAPAPRAYGLADSSIRQLTYDTAAANRTLDSLGWRARNRDGIRVRNGVPLRFSVIFPTSSRPRQRVAVLLQEQLKQVGVGVDVAPVEMNSMIQRMRVRDFDAVLNSWHFDATPSSIRQTWSAAAAREGGDNYGSWTNPAFESAIDSAIAAPDVARARSLYRRAYQIWVDDAPAVLLYEPNLVAGAHKRIKLAMLRPDAWWAYLADWSIPADQRIDRDRVGLAAARQ